MTVSRITILTLNKLPLLVPDLAFFLKTLVRILLFISILSGTTRQTLAQCNASFTIQNTPCFGSLIQFKATDTTSTLTYEWDFGDIFSGMFNTDTLQNPLHQFSKADSFTVSLIVNDTNGCSDTVYKFIRILAKPKADFRITNGCSNLYTVFNDLSKAGTGDTLIGWAWDLGNSTSSSAQNPSLIYTTPGTYSIELKVQTVAGCRDTLKNKITIFKTPSARSDLLKVCKNAQVNFVADTLNAAKSFNWDFGDSTFFAVRTASHVYKKIGYLYPTLSVDFGSTTCKIRLDSILVYPLPDASFVGLKDSQCYTNNLVCFKLSNKSKNLKSRTLMFDDGLYDDTSPLTDSIICHNYTDPKGGKYFITAELIDSNACMASFTSPFPVVIFPERLAKFTFSGANGCFKTRVAITNTSNASPPLISKYKWDFGDGGKDSVNWSNFNYTYTGSGTFKITLIITDTNGCSDTYIAVTNVTNTSYTVDAKLDSSAGKCLSNNNFFFKQSAISGASIRWTFTPNAGSTSFSTNYQFLNPGLYYPTVTISKNGCDSTLILDSIVVHGPQAQIGNIINRYQCQIKDTVYYSNTSTLFRNSSMQVLWDAGDGFAPNCTTITKDSINIGKNCRYSKDPWFFKHLYKKGKEACYYTKLVVMDSVLGCRDSVYAAIPLMAPKAKGLFTPSTTKPCPGNEQYKSLTFDLNQSQPTCLKYSWWLMWDSLTARKTGNFNAYWQYNSLNHNYQYGNYPGDSSGNVTIGLIVENGLDSNGKVCRDTGWFHNSVIVTKMSPVFSSNYSASKYYCPNSSLKFFALDSNQASGTQFFWNYGDGTSLNTTNQTAVSHTFKKAGKYQITLSVIHPNGCSGNTSIWVNIGVHKSFAISSSIKCVRDSFQIIELNRYYDTLGASFGFWSNPLRTLAGKELVHFDIGDGNGYSAIGPNPKIRYSYPGTYKISMAIKDSAGCWDTLSNYKTVRVSGVYADFVLPDDSLLCSQTIDLTSMATTIDSTGLTGDFVKTWEWDFGSRYAKSYSANPRRFFAIDNYKIKLKVTNAFGCVDSITKPLVIIGPISYFNFVGDSVGCEPLLITFKNGSKNASTYIWQFNDKSNAAFGTTKDTNIQFSYSGQGSFYPQLIARGQFTKNGITQTCDDIYPDTSLPMKRTVTVWELPKPQFTWITNCATSTTSFANSSTIGTGNIVASKWYFGDNTNSTSLNPVHVYADTGHYRVVLYSYSNRGCVDSVIKMVVVSYVPIANFSFKSVCQGVGLAFKDSSFAYTDRIYLWRWSFGNGTYSNAKNPIKNYTVDNTYQVKLKVTNVAGCSDSITKAVLIYSKPKPAFSSTNICHQSAMDFTNTSTSKQTLQSWAWNFGDGSNSSTWNTTKTYAGQGNYQVKIRLTTVFGCKDSVIKTVTVYPNPIAKISINQKFQCFKYHLFGLIDSSKISSGTTSSKWTLGNQDSSNLSKFNYKYSSTGKYNLRLISISGFNCRDTVYDSVNVLVMPIVNFSINQTNQCSRFNLFGLNELGSIAQGTYTRQWQFGDGNTSVSNPVTHHYTDTGIYVLRLILMSNLGCTDTTLKNVRLWPMPKSQFTINNSAQCLTGNNFILTNTSTVPWGGLNYRWEFGDNSSSNTSNATHSYAAIGTYTILLEASSVNNCKDTIRKTIGVNPMPKIAFRIDDSLQCLTGNAFKFNNLSTISSGTLSYKWIFGDGILSDLANPQHSYSTHGTFQIKLVVTSSLGCTDSSIQFLTVHPQPQAKPKVNFINACINNQNFQFMDSSSIATGTISRLWKFGDSTTSISKNPTKSFLNAKTYKIWLVEESTYGCKDSSALSILIYPKPNVTFSINDTDQCLYSNAFTFTNTATIASGTLKQTWRLGDAKTTNTKNATNSYSTFGGFRVDLISVSDFGCTDSVSASVMVYPMPMPAFTINAKEQCLKSNQFIFTNTSSIASGSLTHLWQFGDTGKSVIKSPVYRYMQMGNYMVKLKSTSAFGCVDSISDIVLVNPMPVSLFSINDSTQCLNAQNFVFNDNSTIASGSIVRQWNFDDATSSNLQTVSKWYGQDTTHLVKLIQTSNRGCLDTSSRWIEVFSVPKSDFSINDTDQCLKQNNFVFLSKSVIRKGSISIQWKFGDNTNSTLTNPAHRYFAFGNYKVTLIATSDNLCVDSLIKTIRVDAMPNVSFTVNDTGQCVNDQKFVFINNSSIPVGTLGHLWKFGDGTSSTVLNPVKTYLNDATYAVLLTETSNKGCKDSVFKIMDVYPKPFVYFSILDSVQCLYQNSYTFTNKSVIKLGTMAFTWNFGDGNIANTTNSTHNYTSSGNYKVRLYSLSNLGCRDSAFKIITVAPMPKVNFKVNDAGQCFRIQNFSYTNTSTLLLGTMSSKWYFGDLDSVASQNAVHTYKAIGNYKPKLIMTSNYGCKDSLSADIWVNPNAIAKFAINDSDQCINQQDFSFTNTSKVSPGLIKNLLWNCGNGKVSNLNFVKSYYPQSGNYLIVLQTTTDSGCIDSFQNTIRVYPKPNAKFIINDSAQCLYQNNYIFTERSYDSLGALQYAWDINNENQQTANVANYKFGTPGKKIITLIVNSQKGCGDTVQRDVFVKPMPDPNFELLKSHYCELTGPYTFKPITIGGNFYGKNSFANTYLPIILWEDTLMYRVTVNGCTDSSIQYTNVYPGPRLDLGRDTILCKHEALELGVKSWQSKIIWSTGNEGPNLKVLNPGIYSVTVSNICGSISDTIEVGFRPINCRFFLPTAFTPNQDGLNDRYKPILYDVGKMAYRIFSRWGEILYEGNESDNGWDGTYKGEMVPLGNYLIHSSYTYSSGSHLIHLDESGMFLLIR